MHQVLLVDDEDVVLEGLARFVRWQDYGFQVAGKAASVARALMILEEEKIDLVVTDIQMPIQNGIDLMRILAAEYPDVRIIVLSSYSEFSYAQQAMHFGALDYLTKPISFTAIHDLLERLQRLFCQEQKENQQVLQNMMAQSIIMNLINGHPYEETGIQTFLKPDEPVHLFYFIENDTETASEEFFTQLIQVFAPGHLIPFAEKEWLLFAETSESKKMTEQKWQHFLAKQKEKISFSAGVSDPIRSHSEIRKAALQARKAANYQKIRESEELLFYAQIKNLYVENDTDQELWIQQLIEQLVLPEKRNTVLLKIQEYFHHLENHLEASLEEIHQFSTHLLLEAEMSARKLLTQEEMSSYTLSQVLMNVYQEETILGVEQQLLQFFSEYLLALEKKDRYQVEGELISQVKHYIQLHYSENLTLQILSEYFFVTPVYLSRLFKQKTNVNFVDYLTSIRMEKAKELLLQTNLKIYQVAEMVGYENPRYFTRVFKELIGETPN